MPLSGVMVIELGHIVAAPYCAMMLADVGARVIKVEQPSGDEARYLGPPFQGGEGTFFLGCNRNKESVVIDLTASEGAAVLRRLVQRADVLIHNYRPGVLERWGLSAEALMAVNPRLIYCSMSGFGESGPYAHRAGVDFIFQAMSGFMSVVGKEGEPEYRVQAPVADVTAALYATIGILAALRQRDATGKGQTIEISLLDAMIALQGPLFSYALGLGQDPERVGNRSLVSVADVLPTSDGQIVFSIPTDRIWRKLCQAVGLPELMTDPRYATNAGRQRDQMKILSMLAEKTRQGTTAEWLERLNAAGVPAGPIYRYSDVVKDPQVQYRGMITEVEHPVAGTLPMVRNPLVASAVNQQPCAPPQLGQHTRQVLSEFGFSGPEIDQLEVQGIIRSVPPHSADRLGGR